MRNFRNPAHNLQEQVFLQTNGTDGKRTQEITSISVECYYTMKTANKLHNIHTY